MTIVPFQTKTYLVIHVNLMVDTLACYNVSLFAIVRPVRFTFCGVGGILVLSGLIFLTCIDQDDARHTFGYSGGIVKLLWFIN